MTGNRWGSRRPKARTLPQTEPETTQEGALVVSGEIMPPDQGSAIPEHVWALLQEAGELAATRLRDMLASPTFKSYAPAAQRALLDLALTRAYGLPVRRSLSVNLSTSDADAVAASLADLAASLPEYGRPQRGERSAPSDALPDAEIPDS